MTPIRGRDAFEGGLPEMFAVSGRLALCGLVLCDPLGAAHVGMGHLASLDLLANDALILHRTIQHNGEFAAVFSSFLFFWIMYVSIIVCRTVAVWRVATIFSSSALQSSANISESKRASRVVVLIMTTLYDCFTTW